MNNSTTAAQPLDLDSLTRFGWTEAYIGDNSDLVEDPRGTYVKFDDVAALIAQARAARPDNLADVLAAARQEYGDLEDAKTAIDFIEARAARPTIEVAPGHAFIAPPGYEVKHVGAARLDTTASASIDTPEFVAVLGSLLRADRVRSREGASAEPAWLEAYGALVDHIDSRAARPGQTGAAVDERALFEADAKAWGMPLDGHGDHYSNIRTRNRWLGWQARATLAPVASQQTAADNPIARLQACVSSEEKTFFDVVIVDRARAFDGMDLYAAPVVQQAAAKAPVLYVRRVDIDGTMPGSTVVASKVATEEWTVPFHTAAKAPVAQADFVWPDPPPSKGQSHVLFEDGYAEGWAKAIDTVRSMLAASPASTPEASQQAAAVAAPSEQQANVLPPFAAPAGQQDDCDVAFDKWYAAQSHQLTNEQLCRLIWQRGWQACERTSTAGAAKGGNTNSNSVEFGGINLSAGAATTSQDARDAARYRYIYDNCTTQGGGRGFVIECFVPVDEEDMGVGIDRAMRATQQEGGK